MATEDIGKLIDEETDRRLAIMENPNYEFPPKATVWDWVAIAALIAVSSVLILACMMGVIK